MTGKRILFGDFEFPRMQGLDYLLNEEKAVTDYLFVNEPDESFSMYFEDGFPIFSVPDGSDRDYMLFELKQKDRKIKFFCPEKRTGVNCAVWYFYMELYDERGALHELPGQVRVVLRDNDSGIRGKPRFIEVLEGVKLYDASVI